MRKRARRRELLGGLAALVSFGAGCGPRWTVLLAPSARPRGPMALAPLRFDEATIDGKAEDELVAGLDDDDKQAWEEDKKALAEGLAERFEQRAEHHEIPTAKVDAAVVTLVPTVRRIQTGVFVGVSGQPSKVVIEVAARTINGTTLARVRFEHGSPSSMRFRTLARRLRNDGEAIAEQLARYVVSWRDGA